MTPRYKDVPDHWKPPFGPYRQAPEEYGGEWWFVNPFTGPEPWITQGGPVKPKPLPPGFEEVFGPRPAASGGASRDDILRWEQDLKYFKRAGKPDEYTAGQLEQATAHFKNWGMGEPKFYEGRYGWQARFPESKIPTFEVPAWSAVFSAHHVVAHYQIDMRSMGQDPKPEHPFVPPRT